MVFKMDVIIKYLTQASTWRGIIALATAFGVAISPDLATQIIASGIGLAGVVNVFRNERNK